MKELDEYFAALGNANIHQIVQYLDENIAVTFRDSSRNWSGKSTAVEKFGLMYERCPGFKVSSYSILSQEENESEKIITSMITFTADNKEPWDSQLRYTLHNNRIKQIDHI